jgi:hypothetical protein
MEDKDVEVAPFPGSPNKVPYRVAIVQVTESITGAKGAKMVRVGFPAPPAPPDPNQPVRIIRRPGMQVQLKTGTEGLFYLTKSASNLYTTPMYYDVTPRESANFNKEVEEAKAQSKLLENPTAGLQAKDPQTRFLTAALLVARYRNLRGGNARLEPIAAEESKLILAALAEADWNRPQGRFDQLHPMQVFNQLGLTQKEGWQPQNVRTPQDYANAVRAWLRQNANTYRIQRVVPGAATPRGAAER